MTIHIDVLDAAGNRVADGPIETAQSVSITRELSGMGTVSITVPAGDYDAISQLTNERRVNIYYWDEPTKAAKKLIGSGIIRKFQHSRDASGDNLTVSGPDILNELDRVQTWLAYSENNATVAIILSNLIALASGWSADTSGLPALDPLSIRLDGSSVIKGFETVAKQKGIHFRLGEGKEVEFGAFGDDSGLILSGGFNQIYPQLFGNEAVTLLQRLTLEYDSEALANKIVPLGPGDAEAALNLKHSTRTTPYTIQNMTVNGQTLYYLADATSISEFGAIEKMLRASSVAALSNSEADLENAANALYDVAVNWLQRYAVQQEVFRVSLKNVKQNIKPGQKVKLEYQGWAVDDDGEPVRWVNIRDDYWVMAVTERLELQGRVVDLQLSNIDRVQMDGAKMVIGALDEIETQNTIVKPYLSMYMQPFPQESIDSSHDVILPFEFGDYVARLNQVILRLWTRPFRSNVTGAASGGGTTSSAGGSHRHRMFQHTTTYNWSPGTYTKTWDMRCKTNNAGAADQSVLFPANADPGSSEFWTDTADGSHTHAIDAHTHDLDYGIYDDTDTPVDVQIYVDGDLVSGGPYAPSGGDLELEIDITSMFSETGFQGSHEIMIECGSGQGLVFGHLEVRQTIQSIRVI